MIPLELEGVNPPKSPVVYPIFKIAIEPAALFLFGFLTMFLWNPGFFWFWWVGLLLAIRNSLDYRRERKLLDEAHDLALDAVKASQRTQSARSNVAHKPTVRHRDE